MNWRKHYKKKWNNEYGKATSFRGVVANTDFNHIGIDFASQYPDSTVFSNMVGLHEISGTLNITPEIRDELLRQARQIGNTSRFANTINTIYGIPVVVQGEEDDR